MHKQEEIVKCDNCGKIIDWDLDDYSNSYGLDFCSTNCAMDFITDTNWLKKEVHNES